nr:MULTISPECIES: hypothetical protein [Streptomyces]
MHAIALHKQLAATRRDPLTGLLLCRSAIECPLGEVCGGGRAGAEHAPVLVQFDQGEGDKGLPSG